MVLLPIHTRAEGAMRFAEKHEHERLAGICCHKCWPDDIFQNRMILCRVCGNKRCPHATSHNNACTRSNKPGQPGSVYA